jgi:hypothetical protein
MTSEECAGTPSSRPVSVENFQENCAFSQAIVKVSKLGLDSSYRAMQDISQ